MLSYDEICSKIMIWNILNYIEENHIIITMKLNWFTSTYESILHVWNNKIWPIENQSDECMNFVYNLVKKVSLYNL